MVSLRSCVFESIPGYIPAAATNIFLKQELPQRLEKTASARNCVSQNVYRWNPAPHRIRRFTPILWDNSLPPYYKTTRIRSRNQPLPQEDPVTGGDQIIFAFSESQNFMKWHVWHLIYCLYGVVWRALNTINANYNLQNDQRVRKRRKIII